ncbi:ABC transporter ATP-binding protein [Nocardioides sp.]|uniref:ABC transporter ATP-binding protein n=1 Tax=Nocardioides sp. TaxID=35761 RepID=UPI0039E46729
MTTPIRCESLAAGYSSQPVVRGLDLTVGEGEIVALLGPNGAGKSTTLRTLAGFLAPLGGMAEVQGRRIGSVRADQLSRSGLQYIPEDRALFPGLSARNHLLLGARHSGTDIESVLQLFPGLRPRLGVAAAKLSGGEQQMLALARGMAARPAVMLIDELSTGLAPMIVRDLLSILRRIANDTGLSILLVEQHVALALKFADRAAVMTHGDVVFEGSAADLVADPQALTRAYLGVA